jgi:hypothetical protein
MFGEDRMACTFIEMKPADVPRRTWDILTQVILVHPILGG